ncbi:MAG: NYN domain-containing protein [Candidatus Omnitrophota bacterium]
MSLQYIIDAYNVINHPQFSPALRGFSGVQSSLADFIRSNRLTGSRNNKVILVFDGYPAQGQAVLEDPGLVCLFSRMIEADEKINKLVEESAQPRNIIVVSDDRQVQSGARLLHARVCGVKEFICGKKNKGVLDPDRGERDENKISYANMQKVNAELKKKWLS